jgi:hypothetical protein
MKIFIMVAAAAMTFSSYAVAAGAVLSGMYRLVSEQRTIVDTGEITPTTSSHGYISYDANHSSPNRRRPISARGRFLGAACHEFASFASIIRLQTAAQGGVDDTLAKTAA